MSLFKNIRDKIIWRQAEFQFLAVLLYITELEEIGNLRKLLCQMAPPSRQLFTRAVVTGQLSATATAPHAIFTY